MSTPIKAPSPATDWMGPNFLDCLIDEHVAADFLGYSRKTLQSWRVRGGGPSFVRVNGRSIRYRRRDLIAWVEARLVSSTSQSN